MSEKLPLWLDSPGLDGRVEDLTGAVRHLAILRYVEQELPHLLDDALDAVDVAAQALGLTTWHTDEIIISPASGDAPTEPTESAGDSTPAEAGSTPPAEAEEPEAVEAPPPAPASPEPDETPPPPELERATEPDAPTEPIGPSTPTDGAEGTDAEPESHPAGEGPSAGPETDYPEDLGFDESVVLGPPAAPPPAPRPERAGGRPLGDCALAIMDVLERAAPASAIASEISAIAEYDVGQVRQTLKRLVDTGRVTRDDKGHVPTFTIAGAAPAASNGAGAGALTTALMNAAGEET